MSSCLINGIIYFTCLSRLILSRASGLGLRAWLPSLPWVSLRRRGGGAKAGGSSALSAVRGSLFLILSQTHITKHRLSRRPSFQEEPVKHGGGVGSIRNTPQIDLAPVTWDCPGCEWKTLVVERRGSVGSWGILYSLSFTELL